MKRISIAHPLAMALLLAGSLSCDRVTAPTPTGAIDVAIDTETLDAVRVTVSGAVSKTVTLPVSGSASNILLDELTPGTYAVSVEGLIGGQVARYGEAAAVSVSRGHNSLAVVPLSVFQPVVSALPDTVKVLHFNVEYAAVPHATSYIVQWSRSHTMSDASSDTLTATSAEIVVPDEGRYYFVVRAVNGTVASGGMPSDIGTVYALQAVATVTVLPATPSIVDGTTQQFTAVARDAENNTLTGITLFWASSNNAVATVSQTGLVTSVSPGTATITAVAKGVPGNAVLTVTPLTPTKLVFTSQPTNTVAGQAISSIKVAIQNVRNQTATSDNTTQVTLAIGTNPGGGAMSGTAVATVVNGVASFDNISINRTGANYTLSATATSLTSASSGQFNVTPAAASQLVFTTQPGATTAGVPFSSTVEVEIRDALGNRVTTARDAITLAFGANPGSGTLSGTKTVNAVSGLAAFPGISVDRAAAGYTLSASATGLPGATSTQFAVAAAAVAKVVFTVQPVTVTTDDHVQATVNTQDAFGNLVSTTIDVTVALGANPGSGTLGGTKTVQTSGGSASFTDLEIDKVGSGYSLVATAGMLAPATSATFNVNVGAPFKLEFEASPSVAEPQANLGVVEVVVVDAHGNPTGTNGMPIDIAIADNAGGGTITGTTQQLTVAGMATFNNLSINNAANGYTLQATNVDVRGDTSATFDLGMRFVEYGVGVSHSCGLTNTGAIYCSGSNAFLQLGVGSGVPAQSSTPLRVQSNDVFISLTVGNDHACAIRASDHLALCWGRGTFGALGNNDVVNVNAPSPTTGDIAFNSISTGGFHTCAVRSDNGRVMCWGAGGSGRLGTGGTAQSLVPTLTTDVDAYTSVSAGGFHSCGIRSSDRRVLCWGFGSEGALGNGAILPAADGLAPGLTSNTAAFSFIYAGERHTCGIRASDQRAMCWGNGGSGRLGDNGAANLNNPVDVLGGLRFLTVSGGREESCGATTAGAGFCWGVATNGRLGNGTDVGTFGVPTAILGGHAFLAIRTSVSANNSGFSSCGITADSGVWCWGSNGSGQLGDGTVLNSSIPVRVTGSR